MCTVSGYRFQGASLLLLDMPWLAYGEGTQEFVSPFTGGICLLVRECLVGNVCSILETRARGLCTVSSSVYLFTLQADKQPSTDWPRDVSMMTLSACGR